jgi:hypothetical protein
MSRQLANFAESSLASTMHDTDTAGVVTDETPFPTVGDFMVRIEDELIKITAIEAGTGNIVVLRAQEGTTAVQHDAGSLVKLVLSKDTFEEYFGDTYTLGTTSSRPTTGKVGQVYQSTDIDASWRYQSNGWELVHPCFVPYNGAVDISSWTSFNLGTSNWVVTKGLLAVDAPQSAGNNLRGYYHNKPSAPFTVTMAIRVPAQWPTTERIGITLSDATAHLCFFLTSVSALQLQTQGYTNTTTTSGSPLNRPIPADSFIYIRFRDDNSNWYFEFSYDNKNWILHQQTTRNFFVTPTKVGIVRNRVDTDFPNGSFVQVLGYWES